MGGAEAPEGDAGAATDDAEDSAAEDEEDEGDEGDDTPRSISVLMLRQWYFWGALYSTRAVESSRLTPPFSSVWRMAAAVGNESAPSLFAPDPRPYSVP